jgi:hypothetical protein
VICFWKKKELVSGPKIGKNKKEHLYTWNVVKEKVTACETRASEV